MMIEERLNRMKNELMKETNIYKIIAIQLSENDMKTFVVLKREDKL